MATCNVCAATCVCACKFCVRSRSEHLHLHTTAMNIRTQPIACCLLPCGALWRNLSRDAFNILGGLA